MNSISFHNAIVSLLKGVLDEEHEEVKLVPDESVKGGAPAIEAIDDMFKGGADGFVNSEETKANDRYVDEGDDAIEIDNPDDLINGGAFDDGEESSSTSEEEKEEPAKEKGSSADEKEPAKETPEEENANTENKEPAKETSENKENPAEEPEHEELDANDLEDKPKDDEGELLDEHDSDEVDEHDSEEAIDGTGADNKEPAKVEIPEEAKDNEIEKEVNEPSEEASITGEEESSSEESDLLLTGGTIDMHRVIVITADTKFPYVLRQKHKK